MCRIRSSLINAALLASAAFAPIAAASLPTEVGLKHDLGQTVSDAIPLSLAGFGRDEAVLDWRTPVQTFDIELTPSDWIETADLTLWADPIAPLDADRRSGRDIRISLNGGDAQTVKLTRKGFSARIPLPLEDIRPGRNRVRLELAAAQGVTCLTSDDGGWIVDLSRSRVDSTARHRSRSVFLSEVKGFLARPTSQPMTLGIRAFGDDALGLEALVAQGLALRAAQAPRFALGADAGRSDLTVLAGTRLAISGLVDDKVVLDGEGPRIAVHEGRPLRLVLTGDTEEEVLASVRSFATRDLPDVRRRIATPTALDFAGPLDGFRPSIRRRATLASLGGFDFSSNWGAGNDTIRFDVEDAHGAKGRLRLEIERAASISPDSHVDVALNGRDLGRVQLSVTESLSEFVIPQGWLRARDNRLDLRPVLNPVESGCAPTMTGSALRVGRGSRIEILSQSTPSAGDLSRMARADGPLNANGGEGTRVVLPKRPTDRAYALRILGNLSRGSGTALHAAEYATSLDGEANLLVLGDAAAKLALPRSLDLALSNRGRGHVVGLYPEGSRWIGVVAPEAASSLGGTANAMTSAIVNDLSGGIARVADGHVEVAHIAFDGGALPVSERPVFDAQSFRVDATELGYAIETELDTSVGILARAWSRMELPPLLRATVSRLEKNTHLRGTFEAPRAVVPTVTLADATGGMRAGFSTRELDAKMETAARKVRQRYGLTPISGTTSWTWGDRNLSLMAMILMLAFGLSAVGLFRAESRP